ncbi:MAG TPA: sigma-70 family RNA polymerase sigma factor [Solirubrobacterales bacterium]|nr:sigma-70 family RNA polymerase sigma factor [Solirubrobacterales bacterium]
MSEEPSQIDVRDERFLRRARAARAAGDAVPEREAISRLLEPYWSWARSIAYGKIVGVDDPAADAEEIAGDLLRRLARVLERKLEFDTSFRTVAFANLSYAIKDYRRRSARNESTPVDPVELSEVDARPDAPRAEEMTDALQPYLSGLSERERQLAHDRLVLDLSPSEIGERHGMKRGAVDTAMHRIFKKMRKNAPAGVRDRDLGTV